MKTIEYIVTATYDDKKIFSKAFNGELIRCKDCVFREGNVCRLYIVERHEVDDDDFCSWAERREA